MSPKTQQLHRWCALAYITAINSLLWLQLPAAPGEPQLPVSIATVICELQSQEGRRAATLWLALKGHMHVSRQFGTPSIPERSVPIHFHCFLSVSKVQMETMH